MNARAAVLAGVLAMGAAPSRAQPVVGETFVREELGDWELGLDVGEIIPTQKASFSHVIDNARAYDLLAGESVGDEVAEGWVAPPLPGSSVVAGTFKNLTEVGLHVYRRVNSWLSVGADGGWGFKREAHVDSPGIYVPSNFMVVTYNANIEHLNAPVKLGPTFGPFHPYLLAGPGAYGVHQRATISFNDADDPQIEPLAIIDRNQLCFGIGAGGGFDWRMGERGLIGVDIQYHRVFAAATKADFLLPKLRFSVQF